MRQEGTGSGGAAQSQPIRIGVVGGEGQMGRWLRRFWERRGCAVQSSDRGTGRTNAEVAAWADLCFVAVGLGATPEVIRAVAPHVPQAGALVSIASLMVPSAAALAAAPCEGICAHPVFGPSAEAVRGLPWVIAPIRGNARAAWLSGELRDAGFSVRSSSAAAHDAAMAVVQALLHSLYVALAEGMAAGGLGPGQALAWASPTMRMQLALMARILEQDSALYADLVVGNEAAPAVLEGLAASLQRLAALARSGDRAGFAAAFRAARASFGEAAAPLAADAEAALARLD